MQQTAIENVWLANILTGAIVTGLIAFLGKRLLGSIDKRFDQQDGRIEKAEGETEEVKKNYIRRFELVHEKVDETKGELNVKIEETKTEILKEIHQIQHDKHDYRQKQAESMGELKTTVGMAIGMMKEIKEDVREMRRDNRDFDRHTNNKT
jgi:dsDNA-specific endonuclease/ATPase MutS2